MNLDGFPKAFYDWVQPLVPACLRLEEKTQVIEARGQIFTATGPWMIELIATKEGFGFWFLAKKIGTELRSVELIGHWPESQESLASVLASLPRKAS